MRIINLTIDNGFRHPLRWGRCPINLRRELILGVKIVTGELLSTHIKPRWTVIVYMGLWYRLFSNYPHKF